MTDFKAPDVQAAAKTIDGAVGVCCCMGLLERDRVYDFEVRTERPDHQTVPCLGPVPGLEAFIGCSCMWGDAGSWCPAP